MSASVDVEKFLQKARERQARVDKKASEPSRALSYGSNEDAQNPWPDVETDSPPGTKGSPPGKTGAASKKESPTKKKESTAGKKVSPTGKKGSPTGKKGSPADREPPAAAEEHSPPGKRAYQNGQAGKRPLRTDSMQTEVPETPPAKQKRANTSDLTGSTARKVKHALTRPQTVDQKTSLERKLSAETAQKKLEKDFEDVDETQRDDDQAVNDEKEEEPSEKRKTAHKMYMSKHQMSALYEDFLAVSGNWRNSMVYKTIKSTSRTGRRGIRRWLTRSQLENHFGDKAIVDAMVLRKETDEYLKQTEIREHPDCPGLIQYLVLVDEEHTDEDQDEIIDMFRMEDRGDSSGKKEKEETTEEQAEKERIKKVKLEANKAISQLSKVIRETNGKLRELSGLLRAKSKSVQAALRKDLNDCIAQLSASRAELQAAVDAGEETQIVASTEASTTLIKKMKEQDAASAALPAPLLKMGSFSGKNNSRDFQRSVRLPVAPIYVETVVKAKHDSEQETTIKVPVLPPHRILAFLFDELGLKIPAGALEKYWGHMKEFLPWAANTELDGPLLGLQCFDVAMLCHCSLHNVNLGVAQDATGSTLLFGTILVGMFLVENGYFGDPNPDVNSLHQILVVAYKDFRTFQKQESLCQWFISVEQNPMCLPLGCWLPIANVRDVSGYEILGSGRFTLI
ncbi:unnamed protein product [Symbiodinium sp. CCMP2592]|nr:unnamed protein product [Symbiodinium sp. CCMP2592]